MEYRKHKRQNNKVRQVGIYATIIFLLGAIPYLSFSIKIQRHESYLKQDEMVREQNKLVDKSSVIILDTINDLVGDVLYIADTLKIMDEDGEKGVEEWIDFANENSAYDQIRYIDTTGNEVMRINQGDEGAYLEEQDNLQNKKHRYYFQDTIGLKEYQVYLSKMDLNMEYNRIEQPIKPILRVSTPYCGMDDQLEGIVILNYLAKDLLDQIRDIAGINSANVYIVNSEGYWLFNEMDASKEWAYMYPDQIDKRFSRDYPSEWEYIQSKEKGTYVSEEGIFTFTKVLEREGLESKKTIYPVVMGGGDWYIVSHLDSESDQAAPFYMENMKLIATVVKEDLFNYIVGGIISIGLAICINNRKMKQDKIRYFAEYDTMTGTYNRRAGMEKLTQLIGHKTYISICFIDINGLKQVNDQLGHKAGDELILTITSGIKKHIRKRDFAVRLGGDEFLIILEGVSMKEAEEVWLRIRKYYDTINKQDTRAYRVSASHGIETFSANNKACIDRAIQAADEKMYAEKEQVKKSIQVIKS